MNVERSTAPTAANGTQRPNPWEPTAKYFLLIVAGLAALAIYTSFSRERAQFGAVASIPVDERAALYGRILENLRFCRVHSNAGLDRFCKGEAEFILSFPECDAGCKELGRRFVSTPER